MSGSLLPAVGTSRACTNSEISPGGGEQNFALTLVHELRQPLSAIMSGIEVVRLASDSLVVARAIEVLKRQTAQMARLLDDVLEGARWGRGELTLRTKPVDLRAIVREALADATAALAARGHEIVVAIGSEPLWADVDPQRLHQVLSNLLDNAIKYTDPGGRIVVAAGREGQANTLRISDSGRGLEADSLVHIFDLFSRVRPWEGTGLGIGLSVARDIITRLHGRIEARSSGPGFGSEFIVTLPPSGARPARLTAA